MKNSANLVYIILTSIYFEAELIEHALKGTLNVLGSCKKTASVKRVAVTSSLAAVVYNGKPRTPEVVVDESWFSNPDVCKEAKLWYILSKTLAEEAARKFAKENGIDVVTINPGMVIGPLLQRFCYDKTKVPAGKHLMELVAVDWLKDTKRMDHVARRQGCAIQFALSGHTVLRGNALMITSTISVVLFSTVVFGLLTKPLVRFLLPQPKHFSSMTSEPSSPKSYNDPLLRNNQDSEADLGSHIITRPTSIRMLRRTQYHTVHH